MMGLDFQTDFHRCLPGGDALPTRNPAMILAREAMAAEQWELLKNYH
ncbi:hypothetical protein GCM10007859_28960 [Brevundimonas denitrificans]|uniref:Uncharacterized protein n=1 Tax=Brevundimonas denitrificans TaxID=1443434 RepID=A0ABQ6BNJ5_9CAUL|nr:hypothetical protein GCM10007859_28960 [Brevundimonas denitrificans]